MHGVFIPKYPPESTIVMLGRDVEELRASPALIFSRAMVTVSMSSRL